MEHWLQEVHRNIQHQIIIVPDHLFYLPSSCSSCYNQESERMFKLCNRHVSVRKTKWDLSPKSCPHSCITRKPSSLKWFSSSSSTSYFFPSPFLLAAPIERRFSPCGWLWVSGWQMGLLNLQSGGALEFKFHLLCRGTNHDFLLRKE